MSLSKYEARYAELTTAPIDAERSEKLRALAIEIRRVAWSPHVQPVARELANHCVKRANEYCGPL